MHLYRFRHQQKRIQTCIELAIASIGIEIAYAAIMMNMPETANVHTAAKRRMVIVGNGMVSYKLCERLVFYDVAKLYQIDVFGEEPRPAYDRVHLTTLFQDRSPKDLLLADSQWYQQHGIQLHTNMPVEKIDRTRNVIFTGGNRTVPYDILILATGSHPFVPPFPGNDRNGVFVYRTVEDVQVIQAYASTKKRVAVLGGGLLGLEAAKALRDMGLKTHIVERADFLMPQQLDKSGARLLQRGIEKLGIKIYTGRSTKAIEPHEDELLLRFQDGDCLAVDMVVISAGIRPRDELAKECGLLCGTHGGVIVNSALQCSDKNIHAIGECACYEGAVYGLISPGYEMANVLAQRLAGDSAEFTGGDSSARLKLMGVEVSHLGAGLQPGDFYTYQDQHSYRRCVLEHGRLIGAIAVGTWSELPRVQEAITNHEVISPRSTERFTKTGNLFVEDESLSWLDRLPTTARICNCMNVTKGELLTAYAAGYTSADTLSEYTGASTVCGSCRPQLEELAGSQSTVSANVWSSRVLLGISLVSLLMAAALFLAPPVPVSQTVQSTLHTIEILWRDGFYKQLTGYTILSLSIISLIFSLRKRIRSFSFGKYNYWRIVHTSGGLLALIMIPVHTGFHWGSNLNRWLLVSFICFALIGTVAGICAALEVSPAEKIKQTAFRLRPYLVYIHILLFWPVPILLAFHILKIYYY